MEVGDVKKIFHEKLSKFLEFTLEDNFFGMSCKKCNHHGNTWWLHKPKDNDLKMSEMAACPECEMIHGFPFH